MVRRIYKLCIDGYGPTQIAKKLTAERIPTPTAYAISQGRNPINKNANLNAGVVELYREFSIKQSIVDISSNLKYFFTGALLMGTFFCWHLAICSELCYNDAVSLLMLTLGGEDDSGFAPPQGIAARQQSEAAQLK